MTPKILAYLCIAAAHFVSSTSAQTQKKPAQATRPNIVIILADDMGYGDPQSYNPESKIPTPNIDRIADLGVRFTDAHSPGPWCVPSRYGLLTGTYPHRVELNWRERALIDPKQLTLADLLKRQGYHTGMVGKWHLGFDNIDWDSISAEQKFKGGPLDQGFDEFFGMHASLDIPPYFYLEGERAVKAPTERVDDHQSDDATTSISGAFWRAGDIAPGFEHEEVLPLFTEKAVAFLEEHHAQTPETPFFLYVALTAPHTPWVPTPAFDGASQVGEYGDFTLQVDHTVGEITTALEELGYTDNTLVVFASDNGPVWFEEDERKYDHRSSGNLRGMKIDYWEGGHRVPFLAQWPGEIPAGSVRSDLIGFTDLLATVAAIFDENVELEGNDSINMLPAFRNEELDEPLREQLIVGDKSVRDGPWKYIKGGGEGSLSRRYGRGEQRADPQSDELYNLEKDPTEANNLMDSEAERANRLEKVLAELKSPVTKTDHRLPDTQK